MKKIFTLLLCLMVLLFAVGCDTITEGEVYEKEFRESYTTVMLMPLVISNGETTTTVVVPYTVHYPDRYVIHIKAFIDGEWLTEDFYVDKEVYEAVNVGDMFAFDEERGDLKDEPHTKERAKE